MPNLMGGISGAASGAAAGSALGPWGTAGGAVLGGLTGLFGAGGSNIDFMDLANQQTLANRPNQYTPFGSSEWTQNPDGSWTQNTAFSRPLQGAADSLMTQWGRNAGQGYGTGEDAFNQAFGASWGAAQNALNPLWDQREQASKANLLNQGLDPGSEIYGTQMSNLGDQRARDYQNALYGAVGQGFAAQGQTFNQNRQAWLDPLNALTGMQGLLQMPNVPPAGNYQSAGTQQMAQNQFNTGQLADLLGGAGDLLGAGLNARGNLQQLQTPYSFSPTGGYSLGNFAGQLQVPRY